MTTATATEHRADDGFDAMADAVRAAVARRSSTDTDAPMFTTDAGDLWATYLDAFDDPVIRQAHNCNACRRFIQRYGSLVTVEPGTGATRTVCWREGSGAPFWALAAAVAKATVTGVFLAEEQSWGTGEQTDALGRTWRHWHVPSPQVFRHPLRNAGQRMAELREEHGMLGRALGEFPKELVLRAESLLKSDALYRSEKCLGVAQWLLALHEAIDGVKDQRRRRALMWLAVATAPVGFAHVRSTMIGTLLEDLAAGMPFEVVSRRFAEKMHPLQYQRPQALPSEGQIAAAERTMAQLQTAGALGRRFARLEDLKLLWRPATAAPPPATGGVFAHLRPTSPAAESNGAPATTMTWEKFARTVLPSAEAMQLMVPGGRASFLAFITAADSAAPPIVVWDHEESRNPVTWYVYNGGSFARAWSLAAHTYVEVTGIALSPALWNPMRAHHNHAPSATLLLQGARDTAHERSGGLFPEHLRSEYHGIRRTLEAHFQQARIEGREEATACGLTLQKGAPWDCVVRVTSKGVRALYRLDRWD